MNGKRLRQLRLARGLSLSDLAARMEGIVTKQAISKYENGKSQPSPSVLISMASALGVKSSYLWGKPAISFEGFVFRKNSSLPKKEQTRIENLSRMLLEERIRLQEYLGPLRVSDIPNQQFEVSNIGDAEIAAEDLRKCWGLGEGPIACVVDLLEEHLIHVMEIETDYGFDGAATRAFNDEGEVLAAMVVSKKGLPGERQRLSLLHELGHLVLKVTSECNEEKVAFRFGAAFLAPAKVMYQDFGHRRFQIRLEELLMFKQRYGMSIQAALFRMRDMKIISQPLYRQCCIEISMLGWRKKEPQESPPEQPNRWHQQLLRGLSEEKISWEQAKAFLGDEFAPDAESATSNCQKIVELTRPERQRILAAQAEDLASHYHENPEWRDWNEDDFIEQ